MVIPSDALVEACSVGATHGGVVSESPVAANHLVLDSPLRRGSKRSLALICLISAFSLLTCVNVSPPPISAPAAVIASNRRVDPVIEPWSYAGNTGECIDTGTHRIHSTLRDPVISDRIQIFLPTALDHYRSALVALPEPDGPIDVYLFGSRSEWLAYTRERLPQEAAMYEKIGRGGYTIEGDAVLYDIGRWDTFTIAAHEGWHAYTQRVFRHSLPLWLEEGVACYMEGVRAGVDGGPPVFMPWRNFERFGELREVMSRERFVALQDLVQGTPQDYLRDGRRTLLGYYAQTWALVHFLVEGEGGRYRAGLERLLVDAVEGRIASTLWESNRAGTRNERRLAIGRQVGPAVLREYFAEDIARIGAEYEAFVRAIVRRGNGERIWNGESPMINPIAPLEPASAVDAKSTKAAPSTTPSASGAISR
ncbi:MAG: hypothetical protein DWH97_12680 [Planctomycetota bacterium]|nr:MAG: hypothetical protein DWH97_12680 [Planctomycetota bacterium]RLS95537.1 MAG: hypothetical protein DWI12_04370 [Planctomycetota bacterium]